MLDFDELRLRIRRIGPERFLAVANGPVQGVGILAIGDQPRALRAALNRLYDGGESRDDAQARLREIGRDVSATLFGTDGGRTGTDGLGASLTGALQHARSAGAGSQLGALARAQSRGLRVRLDLPPELEDLPAEALTMPPAMSGTTAEQVIALNPDQSVVRSRAGAQLRSQLPEAADAPDRIHLLVAVAAPDGLPDFSPEDELTALKESLYEFAIKIDVLPHATQARIDEWLDTHLDVPAVVVLVAHARHDESGAGMVYLESQDGTARRVPGRVLAGILGRGHRLRLVILSLCGGDKVTASSPVADFALALLEQGNPAVIGMPVRAGGDGGAAFWSHVIRGICTNRTLDEAVITARARTYTASRAGAVEWAVPMVYLHEDCGQAWLFKAREVGDDDLAVSDPLRQGADAHHKVEASQGRIPVADLLAAAGYARSRRDWGRVVSLVGPKRPRRTQEEEAMTVEAQLELAWPQVEQLCGHLAAGRAGDADAMLGKGSLASQLPKRLLVVLRAEVADAVCYARGRAAEAGAQWGAAAEAYQECLDHRDAATRSWYAQGEVAAAGQDWAAARELFEMLPAGDWDVRSLLERTRAGLHAMAQQAGAAGDWPAAVGYYSQLPPEEEDVAGLVGYAQARDAEAASQWSVARQRYAGLPPALLDVQDRLRYATGCMHAVAGEWDLVVEGFGVLPDSYADGRVGPLRRVARARIAGERGDWREALAHLGSVADTALGGQVGRVRHLAHGKLREDDGDWPAAAAAYARVADADQEAASARDYAFARACEAQRDWGGAFRYYETLPGGYRDVINRRPYAAARLAEDDDAPDWAAVLAAYLAVPDDFSDAQARIWYARLRAALARGQWESAIEAAGRLDGLRDSGGLADYARGRLAAERGDWAAAIACLESAVTVDYADTVALLAYAQGRQYESAGGLQAAIKAYEAAGTVEDAEARRAWLADLLRLWPWAGEGPLVPDPLADRDSSFPYTALRSARITPASSAEAVNDVIYTLMVQEGGMGWRERVAWDELRIPARRLLTDALLHRMRDPERLAVVLSGDGSGGGQQQDGAEQRQPEPTALPTTRELLSMRMGDDGPLLMLLTGDRDGALRGWRDRLAVAPADLIAVHCLAVADSWHARDLEETGAWEQAERAWREALACWAVLLTNSGYWTSWRQSRAARFGHAVLPADTARLRVELAEFLTRELSRYADRHGDAGRPEQGRRYRELIYLLEANLDAAGALEEAGGLTVPAPDGSVPVLTSTPAGSAGPDTVPQAAPQTEAGAEPDVKLVCGTGYLALGRLDLPIAELVRQLERQVQEDDPEASGEQLRRLRSAFSELSAAFSHAEHHRFESALRSLEAQTMLGSANPPRLADLPSDCPDSAAHLAPGADPGACAECRDFLACNPAYALLPRRRARLLQDTVLLAVRAHLCIARDLLPVRSGGAMGAMRAAIEVSESAAMAVRTKEAVLRMILGRVEALTRGDKPQLARLEEALALVTSALPVLGQFGRSMLTAKQAEILAERGIWYRLGCRDEGIAPDLERSLADLREAMRINPDSAMVRAHLARGLIFGTKGLPASAPRDILAGLRLLSQGLVQAPRNHVLGEAWRLALGELEPLLLSGLTMEQLARSAAEYTDDDSASLGPLQRAQYLFAQARRHGSSGDRPGALLTLVRASRAYQADKQIRQALLDALAQYFDIPVDPGTPDQNTSAQGDDPQEGRHA